jgi:hypothetical protein
MWAKGYDVHHIFGFDCCELRGKTHVYTPGKDQNLVNVYLGARKFRATGQMIYQYKELIDFFANDRRISLTVHGDGMLAEAWALLNEGRFVSLSACPSMSSRDFATMVCQEAMRIDNKSLVNQEITECL